MPSTRATASASVWRSRISFWARVASFQRFGSSVIALSSSSLWPAVSQSIRRLTSVSDLRIAATVVSVSARMDASPGSGQAPQIAIPPRRGKISRARREEIWPDVAAALGTWTTAPSEVSMVIISSGPKPSPVIGRSEPSAKPPSYMTPKTGSSPSRKYSATTFAPARAVRQARAGDAGRS